jgi:hypothetical protein
MTRRPRIAGTLHAVSLLLVCCALRAGAAPQSTPPSRPPGGDPVVGQRIAKGISFEGRLWIRGTMPTPGEASGGLVSLEMKDDSRRVLFEGGVLDIARSDHDFWALRKSFVERRFIVSAWRKDHFEDVGQFSPATKDEPIALLDIAGVPVVLSRRTVRSLAPGDHTWRVVDLVGELRSGVQVTAASPANGGSIYVGFDVGEWGGGLQRVDLKTGAVNGVERRDTKDLCGGPLNRECDPVTGVIADPQNKDCVLASVGLVHLFHSTGRILRICGQDVTLVSELPLSNKNEKWPQTEAFYGLAPSADGGFWAITSRALYYFAASGSKEKEYLLPALESVSGIHLSRALPGVVVLQTDVNWAVSTSGYTPLVVPLESPRQ